jgi:hypothetical protein
MTLEEQLEHQVRIVRARMPWWISAIFIAGFAFSALGVFTAIASLRDGGSIGARFMVFAVFFLLFGWAVLRILLPLRPKPRIVPYFASELEPFGGETMQAFRHGRALYLEFAALDSRARSLGVKPLSAFGFAYDHFGQQVDWHAAADGLATVEALRNQSKDSSAAADLETLADVLRIAARKQVPFALVLRLWERDNMQVVCTREARQGNFW